MKIIEASFHTAKQLGILCCGVALISNSLAAGTSVALNDTGSVWCMDLESGIFSSECTGSLQDPEYGRDAIASSDIDGEAGFRFIRVCHNGQTAGRGDCPKKPVLGNAPTNWGCTYDATTRLLWEMKSNDGSIRDRSRTFTNLTPGRSGYGSQEDADGLAAQANLERLCTHQEWFVPSYSELASIYVSREFSQTDYPLDPAFFPEAATSSINLWTSSRPRIGSDANGCSVAPCAVVLRYSSVSAFSASTGGGRLAVRLVSRGFQPAPPRERFTSVGDGSKIRDALTGLVWKRCSEGQSWNGTTCSGTALKFADWKEAMTFFRHQYLGDGNWRLPNFKELISLIVVRNNPMIDAAAFPNTPNDRFFSNTPGYFDIFHGGIPHAYGVDFRTVELSVAGSSSYYPSGYLRLISR